MTDHELRELVLQQVPTDGTAIGNKALLEKLAQAGAGIDEDHYQRIREALLAEGLLRSGRGRGGSVMRAQAALPSSGSENEHDDAEPLLAMQVPPQPRPAASRASTPSAAPRAKPGETAQVLSYRHDDKRKNNPHVGMVNTTSDGVEEETRWAYDPHIDPALQFDSGRAGIETLIDDARI